MGSADPSSYFVNNRNVSEMNYDLMGNFNFNITDNLNFDGLVGFNLRVNKLNSLGISTNGGRVTPGLFTLANSLNPITSDNIAKTDYTKKVDGVFAKAGLGYKGTYYFDATIRRDLSSSLPKDNNTYYYPSVSSSIVFSNLVEYSWLNFGKFRINYAEVGSDTDPYNVYNNYDINSGCGGNPSGSIFLTIKEKRLI